MNKFFFSKMIGMVLGVLMLIVLIGFSFLYLIGTSLGRALYSNVATSIDPKILLIILILFLSCLITAIGILGLKRRAWSRFYSIFCLVIGVCFVIAFFLSFGALGTAFEILLFIIGLIYFLLAYMVKKER